MKSTLSFDAGEQRLRPERASTELRAVLSLSKDEARSR